MHTIKTTRLLVLGCLALAVLALFPRRGTAQRIAPEDVQQMCDKLQQILGASFPDTGTVHELIASMQPDGSWQGIDYLNIGISVWPPNGHLSNVTALAQAYSNKRSPLYHRQDLREAVHRSLDFWLRHNYTSQNWWTNDIGVPNTLCNLFILLRGETTEAELLRALNQMRGTYIDQTGQNRVWRAEIQLKIGLITFGKGRTNLLSSPEDRILQSADVLREEVVVRSDEGIQPDWSFHQHGVQQQFGNYGLSFASTQARWAWVLQGTPVAYPDAKIGILRNYILNGLSQVIWNGVMDISGCGRQLFPDSPERKGQNVLSILRMMEKADAAHGTAYRSTLERLEDKSSAPLSRPHNIYYWRSDLLVHRTAAYYSSVRMCSPRIQSTESGNGENLLGYHLSDGATYVYQTGKEYENIFPVWNWRHVPGVTAYSQLPLPPLSWGGLHNGSDFVGGVSDSTCGAAAFLFERNGLTAHKAWFYTDNGLVCLGAGITTQRHTSVATTLNQSLLNGPIVVRTSAGSKSLSSGETVDGKKVKWVYQDHTGYVFLENNAVHVSGDLQTGNWKRIHDQAGDEPVSKQVFNLWIDHGVQPENASYAYRIIPGINQDDLAAISRKSAVIVLKNDTTLQAIAASDKKWTQAVFYRSGTIRLDNKTTLSADGPCLAIVRTEGKGRTITVATPPEMEKPLAIKVKGHYSGANLHYDSSTDETEWKVPFRGGMYAGSSVTVRLQAL